MMQNRVSKILSDASSVHCKMNESNELKNSVVALAKACTAAISSGKKIIFAGNGGSAADAQHLTAELVNRFNYDRPGIAALSLATDTSVITSVSNDSTFDSIFSRQIEALGGKGDVFIALSTSGRSNNIIKAAQSAREKGLIVAGFIGQAGNDLEKLCNFTIKIPSDCTPRIQEGHILFGHILCDLIEGELYPKSN